MAGLDRMKRLVESVSIGFAVVVALGFVAGTSVAGALAGSAVWWASAVGATTAAASVMVGRALRLLEAEVLALSLVAFGAVGGFVVAAPVPDHRGAFDSLVNGWADLLSSVPPVVADSHYRVLPYALAWLATAGGLALGKVVRIPAFGSLAPLGVFGLGLLFSVELRSLALGQGAALTVGSIGLGWLQQRAYGYETDETIGITTVRRRRQRFLKGALILIVISASSPLLAPFAPGFGERARFDLRDRLEPPWNPLDEPSPLAQIKANYRDGFEQAPLFVIRGEKIPRRWRLASMGVFDGEVWNVGDLFVEGNAPFVQVDAELPVDPQWVGSTQQFQEASRREFEVEIIDADAPWLPVPNQPVSMESLSGPGEIRFNAITRMAARPSGVLGAVYRVEAVADRDYSDLELHDATFPFPVGLGLSQQASNVRDWSADLVEANDRGWAQIVAVREDLRSRKYLSDDAARPGHSWGRLQTFFNDNEVFGYEEQFAAAAGIAGRNAELNVRVVVGYLIDDTKLGEPEIVVTRTEASAWIEVLTEEFGWVPIDVTPDRDDQPTLDQKGKRTETVAAPNPPPPPPPPSDVEFERDDIGLDPVKEPEPEVSGGLSYGAVAIGALATPAILVGGWAAVVVLAKSRRRRRRAQAPEPAARIAGAWLELNDRLIEVGDAPRLDESVGERARSIESEGVAEHAVALARAVDEAAFAASAPVDARADDAWHHYVAAAGALHANAGRVERARRSVRIAPLRTGVRG
jgi:hypothetical protein